MSRREFIIVSVLWSLALGVGVAWMFALLPAPPSRVLGLPVSDLLGRSGASPPSLGQIGISLLLPAFSLLLARATATRGVASGRRLAIAIGLLVASILVGAVLGVVELSLLAAASLAVSGTRRNESARPAGPLGSAFSKKQNLPATELMADGVVVVDERGIIRSSNIAAARLIGHAGVGRPIARFVPALEVSDDGKLSDLGDMLVETELRQESSEKLPIELSLSGHGEPGDWHGVVRITNITQRMERTARLERLALHDSLTGLPNRVLLHDRIHQALSVSERRREPMAILLLDLDKFKQVNDNLGHHIGDLLLRAVGPRLSGPLRKTDTLSRLGGDEFAVLLPPATPVDRASAIAERLVEEILDPFVIEGMKLDLGVSIGVAVYPQHGTDMDTLIQNADAAMYKAKRGRLGYCVFDSEQDYQSTQKTTLQKQLKVAIDNADLDVVYQPKVCTGSLDVSGVEALVRWNHPQRGTLLPADFIQLAEQTGLIMPLTLAVMNNCLEAQRLWRHEDIDMPLAVNISGKWLQDKTFPKILRLLLSNWNGRADRLTLEIPEGAIMTDPDGISEVMRGLVEQEFRLSLDDFGTGYSSLPMLQRLPLDELKIDRGFIGGMIDDDSSAVVVRSIVKLAHGLGLRVVAEGVESRITADWLASLGCDELQGYHICKPIAAEAIPGWLRDHQTFARRQREAAPA